METIQKSKTTCRKAKVYWKKMYQILDVISKIAEIIGIGLSLYAAFG
jgi:hypothetical protein